MSAGSGQAVAVLVEFRLATVDRMGGPYFSRRPLNELVNVKLTIGEADRTRLTRCVVASHGERCEIEFSHDDSLSKVRIDDQDFTVHFKPYSLVGSADPIPILRPSVPDPAGQVGISPLSQALRPFAHNRTSDKTLRDMAEQLVHGPAGSLQEQLNSFKLRKLKKLDQSSNEFNHIRALVFANHIPALLMNCRLSLGAYASGISYLGPFRQQPERFYRQKELAVEFIEPHGENLAMFLRALSQEQLDDFSTFAKQHLGFGVRVDVSGSHVVVLVQDDAGNAFNLIDMGYGFSQVLPVLAQSWATLREVEPTNARRRTTVFAIEQPELHLHPRYQTQLADMFVGLADAARKVPMPNKDDWRHVGSRMQAFPLQI